MRWGSNRSVSSPQAATDPLLGHYRDGDAIFQWHMDTFEPPAGATLLATGDQVRHQAFRVGERAWGIQWHLEIDRPELESWLDIFGMEGDLLTEWGKSAEEVRAEADTFMAGHEAARPRALHQVRGRGAGDRGLTGTTYRPLVAVVGYHLAPGRVHPLARRRLRRAGPVPRRAPTLRRPHPDREPG